jgi:hypothetical protein
MSSAVCMGRSIRAVTLIICIIMMAAAMAGWWSLGPCMAMPASHQMILLLTATVAHLPCRLSCMHGPRHSAVAQAGSSIQPSSSYMCGLTSDPPVCRLHNQLYRDECTNCTQRMSFMSHPRRWLRPCSQQGIRTALFIYLFIYF